MIIMRRSANEEDEPRNSSGDNTSPYPNRMDDFMIRQRASQQPEGPSYPRGMDDIVLRQQQLLQEQQYQGQPPSQRNPNRMQDFSFQGQQQPSVGMPSLMEISRAEEILAAAREAIAANAASGNRSGASASQFAGMPPNDYSSNPSMMNPPEGRWASAYGPTPLRPPGPNAPIATGGLQNPDLQLLLSKQNQAMSLATANAPQPSPASMRQAMMNQMPTENMGVLESLLLRQEEERLLMNKRQRGEDSASAPPKKYQGINFPAGIDPQTLGPQMIAANKNLIQSLHADPSLPKPRRRRAKTFPVKLMECLIAHYDERYAAWLPDGRSFVIIHPDQFIDHIVSKTFKNSKYASFVRKLNRWGFARLTSGTGTDCFYHPLFQRDRIDLAAQMLCMPRNDSASAKRRAKLGIRSPTPPIITARDVNPQDRPSLAGVEKFFAERDSAKGSSDGNDDDQDDSEPLSPDRKQPAVSSPGGSDQEGP